jgi:hypothetical protein
MAKSNKTSRYGVGIQKEEGARHNRFEAIKETRSLGEFMLQNGSTRGKNQGVATIGSLLAQDTSDKPVGDVQIGIRKLMQQ